MPPGPERRSARIRRRNAQPVPTQTRPYDGQRKKVGRNDTAIRRFLRLLYLELYQASTDGLQDNQANAIKDLILRARTRSWWSTLNTDEQSAYSDRTNSIDFDTPETEQAFQDAFNRFSMSVYALDKGAVQDDSIEGIVRATGYPTLSICLHSQTFRAYMMTGDSKFATSTWAQQLQAIVDNRSSLELFARRCGIDFMAPIRACNDEIALLLRWVFRAHYTGPRAAQEFGIDAGDMDVIHDIPDFPLNNVHWVLPADPAQPAQVCELTYTVGADVHRDIPELVLNDERTEPQEIIEDSIILRSYGWPNTRYWPADDPRESGYQWPCEICGARRGPLPRITNREKMPKRCPCTPEHIKIQRRQPPETLYELVTEPFGTGVRILQNLHKDDLVSMYIGEIYPKGTHTYDEFADGVDANRIMPNRYLGLVNGHNLAGSYIMDAFMARRHWAIGKTKKVNESDTIRDDDMAPLPQTEFQAYAIDAALKGNMTRYINHSCDPNTYYQILNIGQRDMMAVTATKDIAFGDILTVDYGRDYFSGMDFPCQCRMSCCLLWNPNDLSTETRSLGQVANTNDAPAWLNGAPVMPASPDGETWRQQYVREIQARVNGGPGTGGKRYGGGKSGVKAAGAVKHAAAPAGKAAKTAPAGKAAKTAPASKAVKTAAKSAGSRRARDSDSDDSPDRSSKRQRRGPVRLRGG